MKHALLILSFCLLFIPASAQRFIFTAWGGYATYLHEGLRESTEQMAEQLPFQAEITDNYPGYFFYAGSLEVKVYRKHYLGLYGAHHFTGARVALADYSGSYYANMHLSGVKAGLQYTYRWPLEERPVSGLAGIRGGPVYSTLKYDTELTLDGEVQMQESQEYYGHNWYVEPFVGLSFRVAQRVRANWIAGYEYGFARRKINANWTGIRTSAGLSVSF